MFILASHSPARVGSRPWLSVPLPHSQLGRRSAVRRLPRIHCRALQEDEDWVSRNLDTLRAVPLAAGALGVVGVLTNRVASGIAPVVTASSAQSRADVLVIVLSAVLMLTGLQWLSLKPKPPVRAELVGRQAAFVDPALPPSLQEELEWAWRGMSSATRARSLVVFYGGRCIAQLGVAPSGVEKVVGPGPICQQAMQGGRGNYLANLVLFPGRVEFVSYLPPNTQAALIQPIGSQGVLVLGSDTQRGFSRLDQAWVAAVAEKLEVAFESSVPAGAQ